MWVAVVERVEVRPVNGQPAKPILLQTLADAGPLLQRGATELAYRDNSESVLSRCSSIWGAGVGGVALSRSPVARPRGAGLAPVSGNLDGQEATDALEGHQPIDPTWMDIPEEERQRLLQETDDYLAELTEKVGQPSAKHVERAKRLVESLQ